jgi:multiple sugar transport system permease protein
VISKRAKETVEGYLFLLPSLIVLGIFVFWPVGFSFVLSFFKWDFRNMRHPVFGGLANYMEIFRFSTPPKYPFWESLLASALVIAAALSFTYALLVVWKDKKLLFLSIVTALISVLSFWVFSNLLMLIVINAAVWFLSAYLIKETSHRIFERFWSIVFVFVLLAIILNVFIPHNYDIVRWLLDAKERNDFLKALYNTTYYVILSVPITLVLALGIALLLNANIKFKALFRTSYFIPFVTSVVAISLVWQWIFNDEYGLLNYLLSFFGAEKIAWLKDERWTIPTIAIVSIWKTVGYDAVIFLAGLQNIDKFYYEAAEVDGANTFQKFLYITWPLLSPTTFFLTIVSFIGAFKVFAQVFVLYQGLPGPYNNSGLTMVYYVFDLFYNQQRMGMACAAAYLLFGVILIFTFIQFRLGRRMVEYVS